MQFSLASAIEGDEGTYAIEGFLRGVRLFSSLYSLSLSPLVKRRGRGDTTGKEK